MKHASIFIPKILKEILTGFAQVMLQPSFVVGAAFVGGALMNSFSLTVFGLVGCFFGTFVAYIGKFPKDETTEGLYGFNGALVGLGIGYFYNTFWPFLIFVIIGGMVSSVIMYRMLRYNFKPLTFPFVLTTWAIIFIISASGLMQLTPLSESYTSSIKLFDSIFRGYGQVLFQENIITGFIFIAAIGIRNWIQGIYATLGTFIGLACGYFAELPIEAINLGLFGYNGVLCGILFAGKTGKDFISAVSAIILSVAFVRLAHLLGIPALTFPFVISSWIILWGRKKFLFISDQ